MVAPGVTVFHLDELEAMFLADGFFFAVPFLHEDVLPVHPAVRFDGEHREFLPTVLLVHHKIEPACTEQVQTVTPLIFFGCTSRSLLWRS